MFDLTETLSEIRIFDEKSSSTQSLFARDPTPQEQLAYERERVVVPKKGKTKNRMRETRIKFGLKVLDRPQSALTPKDEGYGFRHHGEHVPLTADVTEVPVDAQELFDAHAKSYGTEWSKFILELEPWKLFLLARAPQHLERVGIVVFEGAADYKQSMADDADDTSEDEEEKN